jgi:predicted Fe-Mo cluster-binding NifX family protein
MKIIRYSEMKIAIPTNDKLKIVYHLRFAHGFMIYEIEDDEIRNKYYRKLAVMNNTDMQVGEFNYSHFAQILTDCDLVILYAMNSEIEQEFKKAKIEIFITSETDLLNSIKLYKQGKLMKLVSYAE